MNLRRYHRSPLVSVRRRLDRLETSGSIVLDVVFFEKVPDPRGTAWGRSTSWNIKQGSSYVGSIAIPFVGVGVVRHRFEQWGALRAVRLEGAQDVWLRDFVCGVRMHELLTRTVTIRPFEFEPGMTFRARLIRAR